MEKKTKNSWEGGSSLISGWRQSRSSQVDKALLNEAHRMDKELPLESLEFITVRSPMREEKYMGLKGTFATLLDSCCRKQALPGFYGSNLIAEVFEQGDGLNLTLTGEMTDEDLLICLDVAIRNVGGFPTNWENQSDYCVNVKC